MRDTGLSREGEVRETGDPTAMLGSRRQLPEEQSEPCSYTLN